MGDIAVSRPRNLMKKNQLNYNPHNSFVNWNPPAAGLKKNPFVDSNNGSDKSNRRRKRCIQKNSKIINTSRGGGAGLSSSPLLKEGPLVMGQVKILKRGEKLAVSLKDGLENKTAENSNAETGCLKKGLEEEEDGKVETVLLKDGADKMAENMEVPGFAGRLEKEEDLALSTTDRLGPEPQMVPKQMKIADFYSGLTFVSSPPPSSLPLPAFFKKKSVLAESYGNASSGLQPLLRLNLP